MNLYHILSMDKSAILVQIQREYALWLNYVRPARIRYRDRIMKRNPQATKSAKIININMIWNYIDTLIASFFTNWVKCKFISRQWWIWEEEAQNLNAVAEFDEREWATQQLKYQVEQDSLFFGVWILNKTWFDHITKTNTWKAINPLSWIPDPLPTQTWQFDWKNYRFHGFCMLTNIHDVKDKYDKDAINRWFAKQYNMEDNLTREAYQNKAWTWPIMVDEIEDNFALDIYTHYTIVDWRKWKFVLSADMTEIFYKEELKPVTKEEKLDPTLIPRPVLLNYYDPVRWNPFGTSICDKVEDKQNAKSILANLSLMKAKREATGGDFLVNSRLIKNKEELQKKTFDQRYLFIDENEIGTQPIQNAMYELPQSQIKTDVWNMMSWLENEAKYDSKIDSLQQWIMPDKSMTKAEAQQLQANANMQLSIKNTIKQRFYRDYYFQRWRGYLENFKDWEEKRVLLNADFEWTWASLTKDQFITKQMPYIMVGATEDINAMNEKDKNTLMALYPIITNDPEIKPVNKAIFKRLYLRATGLKPNTVNSIFAYTPEERIAKSYVDMVNLGAKPTSLFKRTDIDFYTVRLYMQKAEDGDLKDEILQKLNWLLLELWEWQTQMPMNNEMANSAANIMMSQWVPTKDELITRDTVNLNSNIA